MLFFFTSGMTCILKETKKSFWQPTTEDTTKKGESPLEAEKPLTTFEEGQKSPGYP